MILLIRRACLLLLALPCSSRLASAQAASSPDTTAPPPAAAADVQSADAILHAMYDVISGPAGARNWPRFLSLFAPGARLQATRHDSTGAHLRVITPADYVRLMTKYTTTHGFFEREIARKMETYGAISQVFSTYATRNSPDDATPIARGINSYQLFNDGKRWYVVSILWDDERPETPIPSQYLEGHK